MGMVHVTLGAPHSSRVAELGGLASFAINHAQREAKEANRLAYAKAEALSQEELEKLRPYGFTPREGPEDVGKSRRGGRRRKI